MNDAVVRRLRDEATRILRAAQEARKTGERDHASRLEKSAAEYLDDAAVLETVDKRLEEKHPPRTDHSPAQIVSFAAAKRAIMSRRTPRG